MKKFFIVFLLVCLFFVVSCEDKKHDIVKENYALGKWEGEIDTPEEAGGEGTLETLVEVKDDKSITITVTIPVLGESSATGTWEAKTITEGTYNFDTTLQPANVPFVESGTFKVNGKGNDAKLVITYGDADKTFTKVTE